MYQHVLRTLLLGYFAVNAPARRGKCSLLGCGCLNICLITLYYSVSVNVAGRPTDLVCLLLPLSVFGLVLQPAEYTCNSFTLPHLKLSRTRF